MSTEQILAIGVAAGLVALMGLLVGVFLGLSGKFLSVPTDEKQAAVRACLPGNNCGGCGYSGCDALAKAIADGKGGFLRSKWCGALECEMAMKERAGVSSRCMPLAQSGTEGVCPVCGKKCTTDIYWGVAY